MAKTSRKASKRPKAPKAPTAKKRNKPARKPKTVARKPTGRAPSRAVTPAALALFAPVKGAERRDVGRVTLDVGRAGAARIKRMIYPVGFRWSVDMKPAVGTALCMHAHAGFLAHGEIHVEYADGCVVEHKAPQIVSIEPGHDGWVVGNEPVVIIEVDFEGDTVSRLGMPAAHSHS
jgi:hypothetical protein